MLSHEQKLELIEYFSQFISEPRRETIERVLAKRTKHITIVLEDIFQSQNGSAVVRTCECMGLQEIHIIENKSKYELNTKVLKGANKWMNLVKHNAIGKNNTALCFNQLREQGYKIIATDPSEEGVAIEDVPVDQKLAILLGNELSGTSEYALANADMKVRIPMFGFTESLNISVSAAICLNTVMSKARTIGMPIGLSETETIQIRYEWYRKAIRRPDIVERDFLANQSKA